MPRDRYRGVVIAPDQPGDAVCARHAIELFSRLGRTALVFHERLAGLFVGLPADPFPYRRVAVETTAKLTVQTGPDTTVYDLLCDDASGELCSLLPGRSVGVPDPVRYDDEVPWTLGTHDDTHYAVRLTRYLKANRTATVFEECEWRQSHFRCMFAPSRQFLALAPGCGRLNTAKRWPMIGWREVATWAIAEGLSPIWFVGPDELELIEECKSLGGEVVTGNWSEVVEWHGRCAYGVTNDTVHLHIRAYSGVSTVGLFLVSSVPHWGNYPGSDTSCLTLASTGASTGADIVLSALERLMELK